MRDHCTQRGCPASKAFVAGDADLHCKRGAGEGCIARRGGLGVGVRSRGKSHMGRCLVGAGI